MHSPAYSDVYHHDNTTGNLSNRHHLPPQMLLRGLYSRSVGNNNSSLLFNHYPCDEAITTDSSPPVPLLSSSSAAINHKEAEKRRRERINSHLNRLRTLLPCNSKTDKASLLAKAIQRLKELKQAASEVEHLENIPSEADEVTVISLNNASGDERVVIKASLCCEDRSDLVSDVIQTLKSLQLTPLRVEMVAIGGRIRNIVLVECHRQKDDHGELVDSLKEALSSLIASSSGLNQSSKRRRMFVCT